MPRRARIDAPGAVHHIIARGIERRNIFYDDQDRDAYLKELVRHIHLNPLRARVVTELKALDRYPYCGHSCLTGRKKNTWQTTEEVPALFSGRLTLARRRYREYLKNGIGQGRRTDLMGDGLVRSAGGWAAVRAMPMAGVFSKSDERILGSSDFVEDVPARANSCEKARNHGSNGRSYLKPSDSRGLRFNISMGSDLKYPKN